MDWSSIYTPVERREVQVCERFVCTVWSMAGASGKVITCNMWETAFGLELRVTRSGEFIRSQLCREGEIEAATVADEWALALEAKGFTEA